MTIARRLSRRAVLQSGLAGAGTLALGTQRATAQPSEIKIAMIVPLSGPWARFGQLEKMGADLAIRDVNEQGGIKALGGAKLRLIAMDAGDNVEKAKSAAQRLVSTEPDVVAGAGAWLSSFTLAVTEVTERAELPWLTMAYSDQITLRGFKNVFQTSQVSSAQTDSTIANALAVAEKATGKRPANIYILRDNTAGPTAFVKPLHEGGFDRLKLKSVGEDIFTPPMADATPLIQRIRSARPQLLLLLATTTSDVKLVCEKLNEFGLGQSRMPMISSGGGLGPPELLKLVGKDLLEGLLFGIANWPAKGHETIGETFKKESGEPWMTQDTIGMYGHIWIIKEALEIAGKADRKAVGEAMRTMETKGGSGRFFPGNDGVMKFDEKGRRVGAEIVMVQWRDGEPITVHPASIAVKEAVWPKR
jgi:branched-chain amino acid transport system substrate-binding protein